MITRRELLKGIAGMPTLFLAKYLPKKQSFSDCLKAIATKDYNALEAMGVEIRDVDGYEITEEQTRDAYNLTPDEFDSLWGETHAAMSREEGDECII